MRSFDVSADPGTNNTGLCDWINGKLVSSELPTLRPPDDLSFEDKLFWIKRAFKRHLEGLTCHGMHKIGRIAIEKFEPRNARNDTYNPKISKESMMMCAAIRGMLLSVAEDFTKDVISVSKGKISKVQTAMLAQSRGITKSSKDSRDAFQIGVCAGFDKRRA